MGLEECLLFVPRAIEWAHPGDAYAFFFYLNSPLDKG